MIGSQTEIQRDERRYLVKDPAPIIKALRTKGKPDQYNILTAYLSPPRNGAHYRLRYYNDEPTAWMERKQARGKNVVKHRVPTKLGRHDVPNGFRFNGRVTYSRLAWDLPNVRVTVDQNVKSGTVALPSSVVEVKGDNVPSWLAPLLPQRAKGFSKRRWAQGKLP